MQNHWWQQVHLLMGPHETIGNNSCIFQWAQTKPLMAAAACANEPCAKLSTVAGVCANGPTRYQQQQQQQQVPMGLNEAIDSTFWETNGPM